MCFSFSLISDRHEPYKVLFEAILQIVRLR
jgi:hypothetical protein